jgi:hypothetical protein
MHQAKVRDVFVIYLTYGVYDSIHPAMFKRFARPGRHTTHDHIKPGSFHKPFSDEDRECALFLTSEIGQRSIGMLHGGILQVKHGVNRVSIQVTVKLAFAGEHQRKLFHEWSVYMHMESKGIVGVQPILGIFHETGNGPSCLVLQHFGVSIYERSELITPKQW